MESGPSLTTPTQLTPVWLSCNKTASIVVAFITAPPAPVWYIVDMKFESSTLINRCSSESCKFICASFLPRFILQSNPHLQIENTNCQTVWTRHFLRCINTIHWIFAYCITVVICLLFYFTAKRSSHWYIGDIAILSGFNVIYHIILPQSVSIV